MSTASEASCENCASNFSLFKRKKSCNYCKQSFCQFCVSRPKSLQSLPASQEESNGSNNNSSDRICAVCQSIVEPHTTTEDLMKIKLKHLRSFLNAAGISTSTCKEKRDLAELAMRSRIKLENARLQRQQQAQAEQQQQQAEQQPNPNNNQQQNPNFNDRFSGFMSNVQDFVNFNLNSVLSNPPVPCPAPSATAQQQTSTNNSSNYSQPNGFTTTNSSTTSNSNSLPNNLNSVFNFIGEQLPSVINNNLFTFNNNNNTSEASSQNIPNTNNTSYSYSYNPSSSASRSSTLNPENATNASRSPSPPPQQQQQSNLKRRASLSQINSENDIENLSIKQIKEILASNFVEYKGCCEKNELIDKVKRLYKSDKENKRLETEINENDHKPSFEHNSNTNTTASNSEVKPKKADESDLCKICMESIIDCVLLDCGHMCSCIKCGKQLGECPICRQYVVKVIRVFKS